MIKKILYISILIFSISAFSQEEKMSKNILSNVSVSPNPFSEKTTIIFYAATNGNINFIVQDLLGNTITSTNIITNKGMNFIPFYRDRLSAGIYVYTLKTKDKTISKRFVIK